MIQYIYNNFPFISACALSSLAFPSLMELFPPSVFSLPLYLCLCFSLHYQIYLLPLVSLTFSFLTMSFPSPFLSYLVPLCPAPLRLVSSCLVLSRLIKHTSFHLRKGRCFRSLGCQKVSSESGSCLRFDMKVVSEEELRLIVPLFTYLVVFFLFFSFWWGARKRLFSLLVLFFEVFKKFSRFKMT